MVYQRWTNEKLCQIDLSLVMSHSYGESLLIQMVGPGATGGSSWVLTVQLYLLWASLENNWVLEVSAQNPCMMRWKVTLAAFGWLIEFFLSMTYSEKK